MIRSKHNDKITIFEGTLQVPPEGHTIRRLVPVVYRKDATQKCQNASQCNRMPHRRLVLFSSVVCVWVTLCLSLCLFLCLCACVSLMQKQNNAEDDDTELHFGNCCNALSKWCSDLLLPQCVCILCDCERLFRHFVNNILEVKYVPYILKQFCQKIQNFISHNCHKMNICLRLFTFRFWISPNLAEYTYGWSPLIEQPDKIEKKNPNKD
jgi:hypothetical protein